MKKYLTRQWSFFWAGITFGIAQIIYMIGGIVTTSPDKTPKVKPITVTTDLGKMFRAVEVWLSHTFGFSDPQIYGYSTDGINSGGAFVPGIGWAIFGMALGGFIASRFEKEPRTWVKFSPKILIISFIGGILFSYGTRLAGGCTLNHLLGGIPMMSIHSLVAVVFMSLGGLLAFWLMSKSADIAGYFKHQETRSYCEVSRAKGETLECIGYDPDYNPWKRKITWIALLFVVVFFGVAVYGGLFSPDYFYHLKDGKLVAFNKSLAHKGFWYVFLTLLAGVLAGFGMAKSGFGTECALVSVEARGIIKNDEKKGSKLPLPKITRTLFKGLLPLQGVVASWVLTLAFVIIAWGFLGYKHGFSGSVKYQLTAGVPIGAFLLGAGAVMLIGCEIRSYMRIGMGYLNTWVGFMGFAIGYLPFTLFYEEHKAFLKSTVMVEKYYWPQLFTDSHWGQVAIAVVFLGVLVSLLVWTLRSGARTLNVDTRDVIQLNTEDLQQKIEANAKG